MLDQRPQFETDETGVTGILAAMPRVEAPSDFDFGVKAKIAQGRPARRGGYRWFAAAGVPALAVAVAGGVWLNRPAESPAGVTASSVIPVTSLPAPVTETAVEQLTAPTKEVAAKAAIAPANTASRRSSGPADDADQIEEIKPGSTDFAVRAGKKIYPKGFDPDTRLKVRQRDLSPRPEMRVADILDPLGAAANADLVLESVRENSVAARSGLRTGDVIEAINGKPVTGKTTYRGQFAGKSVTVKREGKSVEVELKP